MEETDDEEIFASGTDDVEAIERTETAAVVDEGGEADGLDNVVEATDDEVDEEAEDVAEEVAAEG